MFSSKVKTTKKMKFLIRGGVPPELRGKVWWACSGASAKLAEASAQQPQPELHIRSHAKAKYEAAAAVMANAQRMGLTKLGIVGSEQFVN